MPESRDDVLRQLRATCQRLQMQVAQDANATCPAEDQHDVERLVAAAVGYALANRNEGSPSAHGANPVPRRPMLACDLLVTADLAMRALEQSVLGLET